MNYKTVNLPEMKIAGLSARTSNLDPEMGSIIGSLWNSFFAQGGPQAVPDCMGADVYGLYSDYESDFRARYDITVGCRVQAVDGLPQQMTVKTVPAGKYAVFAVQGDGVAAVAKAWEEIWSMELDRSYTGDFEQYTSSPDGKTQEVSIYIALK